MRSITGCLCTLLCLLMASCSSSPDSTQPVATFAEPGKPPSAVLGISLNDGFSSTHAQALIQYGSDNVTGSDEREVRIKGRFWGCPGEACFSFLAGGLELEWVIVTVDTPPAKLIEVLAHELMPGEPYLFRRTEDGASWHWSYSSQPLFDIDLQSAGEKGRTSRVVFTQIQREVKTISPRSSSRVHGSYHNLTIDPSQQDRESDEPFTNEE